MIANCFDLLSSEPFMSWQQFKHACLIYNSAPIPRIPGGDDFFSLLTIWIRWQLLGSHGHLPRGSFLISVRRHAEQSGLFKVCILEDRHYTQLDGMMTSVCLGLSAAFMAKANLTAAYAR